MLPWVFIFHTTFWCFIFISKWKFHNRRLKMYDDNIFDVATGVGLKYTTPLWLSYVKSRSANEKKKKVIVKYADLNLKFHFFFLVSLKIEKTYWFVSFISVLFSFKKKIFALMCLLINISSARKSFSFKMRWVKKKNLLCKRNHIATQCLSCFFFYSATRHLYANETK